MQVTLILVKVSYKIDLVNDGTGYTLPPLVGISSAPSDGINATAVAIMTSRTGQSGQSIDRIELTNLLWLHSCTNNYN